MRKCGSNTSLVHVPIYSRCGVWYNGANNTLQSCRVLLTRAKIMWYNFGANLGENHSHLDRYA